MMAVTVITDPGSPTANSYASVAQLDDYVTTRTHSPDISSLTEDEKGALVIDATAILEQDLSPRGSITHLNQALRFPRSGLIDRDYRGLDAYTIPEDLESATCELALYLHEENRREEYAFAGIESMKISTLEFKAQPSTRRRRIPDSVLAILRHLYLNARPSTSGGMAAVLTG